MDKIANADELQAELRHLLAYCQRDNPSRERLANALDSLADRVGGKKVDILRVKPDHEGDWRDSIQRTRLYAKKHMDAGNLKDSPALKRAWSDHKKLIGIIEGLGRKKTAGGAADFSRVMSAWLLNKEGDQLHKNVAALLKSEFKRAGLKVPDGRLLDEAHDLIYNFDGKTGKAATDAWNSAIKGAKQHYQAEKK